MGRVVYYHYTNKKGYDAIRRAGMIKGSKLDSISRDARFGEGVYFTRLPPTTDKYTIAENNWADLAEKYLEKGRVDYVIIVTFPCGKGPKEPNDAGSRNIYLMNGDVDLDDYEYEFIKVGSVSSRSVSSRKETGGVGLVHVVQGVNLGLIGTMAYFAVSTYATLKNRR